MPVYKYLDVSTLHITAEDCEIITADLNAGADRKLTGCDRPEYGFWLHVCNEPDGSDFHVSQVRKFKTLGLSESFMKCYNKARELGCYWMLFDTDAEFTDGLDIDER